MKDGRGKDEKLKVCPTENTSNKKLTVKHGSGGIAIGTENTTMICNAYMHDATMENQNSLLYFKTRHPC